jgi:hypothetical protein
MRGRASTGELHNIIRDKVADDRHLTDKALQRLFEEDKGRLKDWFNVDMQYSRSQGDYELIHIGRPLIDLPDDAIRGLAFLEQTFSDDGVPMGVEVRIFLNTVVMLLPYERLKQVEKQRGLLEMELGVEDTDNIHTKVWEAIKTSVSEHRRLEFDYVAPRNEDGYLRTHLVEPIRYFFDTVRKHYYLEFFWLTSSSPHKGTQDQNHKIGRFRLDRMSNPTVLPSHFPATQRIPTKELIYELAPIAARLGVTDHFPNIQVYPNEDGGAKVVVPSRDLFFDLRTLLHYGANCRVIGGDDALWQMRKLIKDMASVYAEDTDDE